MVSSIKLRRGWAAEGITGTIIHNSCTLMLNTLSGGTHTMPTSSKEVQPCALARGEGTPLWFLGALTFVRATADTTRGAYGLVEQVIPAGFASPFHVHHAEDESFYIIEGELTFFCQGRKSKAGPGGYIFGPREIPHGFRVEGTAPARILLLTTPAGGFEN